MNRRSSRAGLTLENHIEAILRKYGVQFEAQAVTEGKKKADILIPSALAYSDPHFPEDKLAILAIKTTCKDRWRQVLSEADRIPIKHLFTLQAPISENQLKEMQKAGIQLVVPESHIPEFPKEYQDSLWTLAQFIEFAKRLTPPSAAK